MLLRQGGSLVPDVAQDRALPRYRGNTAGSVLRAQGSVLEALFKRHLRDVQKVDAG